MMHAAWFRLAVRLLGVVFLLLGIPLFLSVASYLVGMLKNGPQSNFGWVDLIIWAIPQLSYSLMGAYLLFFGGRLIRACLRDVLGRCDRCGELVAPSATSCPKCGLAVVPFAASTQSPPSASS